VHSDEPRAQSRRRAGGVPAGAGTPSTLDERPGPLELPAHVLPPDLPETFGRYVLLEQIGEGGMANVFQAMVHGSGGIGGALVVKRMRPELCRSPELVRMFADEARITSLLDHPNIVRVVDYGQADGVQFLVMEYLDGKDLAAVMRALLPAGLSLRAPLVAQIGLCVARGLHHAHRLCDQLGRPCRIVHRDVNPANIMLLRSGDVKILDFGIAKAAEFVGRAETQHARLKGKLSYLSPEQARGEPIDGRSDVFSLGITMWELLTGHRLFAARSNFERIRNVLAAPIEPPSRLRRSVPATLDRIVMRALERDLSRRYKSAGEMAQDLDGFLALHPAPVDGMRTLLTRLPSDDPSARRVRAAGATAFGPAPLAASPSIVSGPVPAGVAPAVAGRGRKPTVAWTAAAAATVALAGALVGMFRAAETARPPQVVPGPPPAISVEEMGPPAVRIEVQSEPARTSNSVPLSFGLVTSKNGSRNLQLAMKYIL